MKCIRCGSEMSDDARSCMRCGALNYSNPENANYIKKYADKEERKKALDLITVKFKGRRRLLPRLIIIAVSLVVIYIILTLLGVF